MDMPYWAERLRVRLIHELGGYTDEDVAEEIYRAARATPPCKSETFKLAEYYGVVSLGGTAFNPPADPHLIDSAKGAVMHDISTHLKSSNAVQYRVIPWWDGSYALQATIRVAVPEDTNGKRGTP